MNTDLYTVLDTATIDQQPEESDRDRLLEAYENDESGPERLVEFLETLPSRPSSPAEAKEPLDFAAMRKAASNLPADWDYASYMTLIDMAERCEQWKRKFDERMCQVTAVKQLLESSEAEHQHWHKVADGRLTTIHSLETDRDRLKEQLAEAIASRDYAEQKLAAIESQSSGLSDVEKVVVRDALRTVEVFGPKTSDALKAIIDRLVRQKGLPWLNGKAPAGNGLVFWVRKDNRDVNGMCTVPQGSGWEDFYTLPLSDLLATLPNGDATP
jgi:hypothetical protein